MEGKGRGGGREREERGDGRSREHERATRKQQKPKKTTKTAEKIKASPHKEVVSICSKADTGNNNLPTCENRTVPSHFVSKPYRNTKPYRTLRTTRYRTLLHRTTRLSSRTYYIIPGTEPPRTISYNIAPNRTVTYRTKTHH